MRSEDSVAVGVRLYEESSDPSAHSRDGIIKSAEDINQAIMRMRHMRPKSKFYVFCTHRSSLLDSLDLPNDAVFLTHDDGLTGAHNRLWLLSQCKNHIFTNSTFYWWGCWLSEAHYRCTQRVVLAGDNFINRNSLRSDWLTF